MNNFFNIRYRWRSLIKIGLLALATFFSMWLAEVSTPPLERATIPLTHDPDFFAVNFSATIMDSEGLRHHRLQSDYLQHFLDDDTSELRQPYFTFFQEGLPSWIVTAQQAQISAAGAMVLLLGQVQLRRPPERDNWELDTPALQLYPKRQLATTDQPVEIRHPRQIINTIGMRADLQEKHIELLNHVRSRYEPPSSASDSIKH